MKKLVKGLFVLVIASTLVACAPKENKSVKDVKRTGIEYNEDAFKDLKENKK